MSEEMKSERDDEMPSDVQKPGVGSDGKFHVPSQWIPEPDGGTHHRIYTGLMLDVHRDGELLALLDFRDFAISAGVVQQSNSDRELWDNYQDQIKKDGPVIAMRALNDMGGLRIGDIIRVLQFERGEEDMEKGVVLSNWAVTKEQIVDYKRRGMEGQNSDNIPQINSSPE